MGFKRIHLGPGESKSVTFTLHSRQLGYHDDEVRYAVHPGRMKVSVGGSSQDLPLAGQVEITGERTKVERVFFGQVTVE
jgi:beta-glucosidase